MKQTLINIISYKMAWLSNIIKIISAEPKITTVERMDFRWVFNGMTQLQSTIFFQNASQLLKLLLKITYTCT